MATRLRRNSRLHKAPGELIIVNEEHWGHPFWQRNCIFIYPFAVPGDRYFPAFKPGI